MPEDRGQRQRARHRRQAVRQAQKATRKALSELPAHLRTGTSTRPILKTTPGYAALSTYPSITWGTTKGGKLTGDVRGTARHEVAHHLGAGHPAFRAATGRQNVSLSRQQVPIVVRAQQESVSRRRQRAGVLEAGRRRATGAAENLTAPRVQGFGRPHLREVAKTGTPAQQSRARTQMRRLGRRLRKKGVDF